MYVGETSLYIASYMSLWSIFSGQKCLKDILKELSSWCLTISNLYESQEMVMLVATS